MTMITINNNVNYNKINKYKNNNINKIKFKIFNIFSNRDNIIISNNNYSK